MDGSRRKQVRLPRDVVEFENHYRSLFNLSVLLKEIASNSNSEKSQRPQPNQEEEVANGEP